MKIHTWWANTGHALMISAGTLLKKIAYEHNIADARSSPNFSILGVVMICGAFRQLVGSHFYYESWYYTGILQPSSVLPILKFNNEKCTSDNHYVLSILLFIASLIYLHLSPHPHSCKIFKVPHFCSLTFFSFIWNINKDYLIQKHF